MGPFDANRTGPNLVQLSPRKRTTQELSKLVDDIDDKIRSGEWPPGTRLPTERELEQRLGVSRNTLRKVLRQFEDSGQIQRHVGRGTFVAETAKVVPMKPREATSAVALTARPANSLTEMLSLASPADIMEIRLIIEPSVSELAAHRASARELAQMEECVTRMDDAGEIGEYEQWDARFHETIVQSARNELLAQLYAGLTEARNSTVWTEMKRRSVTPERRAAYQRHHRAILAALLARDGERARQEVVGHLRQIRGDLLGE